MWMLMASRSSIEAQPVGFCLTPARPWPGWEWRCRWSARLGRPPQDVQTGVPAWSRAGQMFPGVGQPLSRPPGLTVAMLSDRRGKPDDRLIRSALSRWGFNAAVRGEAPSEVRHALNWIQAHTLKGSSLRDPATLRRVLDSLAVRLDGKPAGPNVTRRTRSVLSTSIGSRSNLAYSTTTRFPP